ncbi:hypothetical protein PPERSA_00761 [Pseudocohnilembus persalinus]|uniref:C2H2-type domain-containing protein n=1 Tax=Pseudocohnilembus persalinus TaxID=266149 RepID=A0A0V0Q9N3_PSEPJ|nr:hypothetical protein PPERSA_00761 [Pseudocohnilembus persalinus]|eukprot:KRW98934.1 hypothetical protein PPERSA_00761 [Pseudocohnilembus persalinus]
MSQQKKPEKRYNRKKKVEIQKFYKCGHPDCQKDFHDYSSLYTHINHIHNGDIHPDTLCKPPKKKDLIEQREKQKGEVITDDPFFEVFIPLEIIHFLKQVDLISTYMSIQNLISQDNKKLSDFFHAEDQEYFDMDQNKNMEEFKFFYQERYFNERVLIKEYLKPFNLQMSQEMAKIFKIIIQNQEKENEDILDIISEFLNEDQCQLIKSINEVEYGYFIILIKEFQNSLKNIPFQMIQQQQQIQQEKNLGQIDMIQEIGSQSQQNQQNQNQGSDQFQQQQQQGNNILDNMSGLNLINNNNLGNQGLQIQSSQLQFGGEGILGGIGNSENINLNINNSQNQNNQSEVNGEHFASINLNLQQQQQQQQNSNFFLYNQQD